MIRARLLGVAALLCFGVTNAAKANTLPIVVTYTATGTSGDYLLDFSVTNNAVGDLYFFGIELTPSNIVASPYGYGPNGGYQFPTPTSDGSCQAAITSMGVPCYNNTWIDISTALSSHEPYYDFLLPGTTLSGFEVQFVGPVVPAYVEWFAFNCLNPQCGANFPLLEAASDSLGNIVQVSGNRFLSPSVPEPSTWALMLLSFAGLGFAGYRRANRGSAASAA